MTQGERDRLVALQKAKKKLITQKEAAEEMGISERQVRRLLRKWRRQGDRAVVHGLRSRPSNRKLAAATGEEAMRILSQEVYKGFGPTLAAYFLQKKHGVTVSKETLRQWMVEARLWQARRRRVEQVHVWRPRRSCFGELVQWDTSEHQWLEGRGEQMHLIAMIDDASSRLWARFVRHDSTEENMRVLWGYLERHGRPLAFYTDKASLFQNTPKRIDGEDPKTMPPTQIGRALQELNIACIAAHSPQAKGRVERGFGTAQDRLVKGMRVAGVCTLEEANAYLENEFLPWWNETLAVMPAKATDAHRPLGKPHQLAAILSQVEERRVTNDYTVRYHGKLYQIDRKDIRAGLRGGKVRVEKRLDGSISMRLRDRYLAIDRREPARKVQPEKTPPAPRATSRRGGNDGWKHNFDLRKGPKIWQAAQSSGARSVEELP